MGAYPMGGVLMKRPAMVTEVVDRKVEDGLLAIHNMDLDRLIVKLQRQHPRGMGWTLQQADMAAKWYKRFLTIGLKNPGTTIVPNEEVDAFWHMHILDMKRYEEDTKAIFGTMLYHAPTFGERDLRPDFAKTNALLFEEFGEDLQSSGDYEPQSCCCVRAL